MGLHEHQHAHEALHARDSDIFHKLHIGSEGTGLDNKLRFIHHAGKNHQIDNKLKYINKAVGGVGKNAAPTVKTVYSQVYVTESKTFNGPAQYVTETAQAATPSPAAPTTSATLDAAQQSYANAKSLANSPHHASSSSPSSIEPASTPTSTHAKGKPIQHTRSSASAAASSSSKATGRAKGTPLSNSRNGKPVVGKPLSASHSASANVISQKSSGMSGGAKAGLAFGIIIAIALAAGLVYFCWRRKKNQNNGEKLDEKHASKNSFFGGTSAAFGAPAGNLRRSVASDKSLNNTSSAATAPRLSLRPVTQFLPNMMGMNNANKNNDSLNVPPMSEKPRSGWERPAHNPFADASAISEKQARPESPPSNPFEENAANEPGTPTSTTFGTAAAVPVNGNAKAASNNVHRVQLDFKPSMDDELELRSGQLVRMLHEYDDGWALCIRMDRSQQGVCPRTCLSKLPVKPRPQGPPPGPNGRPTGPPPPGMRGPPPAGMVPRPLTPTGRERSQTLGRNSPAPQEKSRVRSMSVGSADRPVSPISGGMPARKPVPGMAM